MKKKAYVLLMVLFCWVGIKAQVKDPVPPKMDSIFTEILTEEDLKQEEWVHKISETDTLEQFLLKLVTSKEKEYFPSFVCVQIFDNRTNQFIQEIDLSECDYCQWHGSAFGHGDFNFDGFLEFSLFACYATGPNTASLYFLYDPEKQLFLESDFSGTSLVFNDISKTIYERNQCCAGTSVMEAYYKVTNNRMVLIEQHCWEADRNEEGDPLFDTEEYLIYSEIDCDTPFLELNMQSVGLKKKFQLKVVFFDEDMAGGYIQYKGQKERIPIQHDHSEIIENHEAEGRPNEIAHFYNELYKDDNTGSYCFIIQGSLINGASYTRKKDKKVFVLKETD